MAQRGAWKIYCGVKANLAGGLYTSSVVTKDIAEVFGLHAGL